MSLHPTPLNNTFDRRTFLKAAPILPLAAAGALGLGPDAARADTPQAMGARPDGSDFPPGFVWGVATAAPQIEGGASADGKGPSNWDVWARIPGNIKNGDNLDVACDHYHRYPQDFRMMADLGVRNYRMSIAWPRIYPLGRGQVNQKGIDFYHRLFDELAGHGITPYVTMFHWDLPAALEEEGGWKVRGVTDAFADYADTIVKAYAGQVKHWITLNEIYCFTRLAYGGGDKAPGTNEGDAVVNQTYHHALICHGHGVRAVREFGGAGAQVGLTDNSGIPVPVTETAEDIAAARSSFVRENIRVLDPIYRGHYDEKYLSGAGVAAPRFADSDFQLISLPTDYLGMNVYTGGFVRADASGGAEGVAFPPHFPVADSPWLKLNARAMYWGPRLAAEIYGISHIYITENGAGYDDSPPVNGEVPDLHRLEYVRACLRELRRAIADGVPVRGYFLWSLMDNFEWQDGYTRRFGIVYNDFKTQERTPKMSARWYSRVIGGNRLV
jgi:beta-glucosidase